MAVATNTRVGVLLGPELFRFDTKLEWVNKGRSWYATCGFVTSATIAIDAAGRVVRSGREFRRAEDDDAYPVIVFAADPDLGAPSAELVLAGMRREVETRALEADLDARFGERLRLQLLEADR